MCTKIWFQPPEPQGEEKKKKKGKKKKQGRKKKQEREQGRAKETGREVTKLVTGHLELLEMRSFCIYPGTLGINLP